MKAHREKTATSEVLLTAAWTITEPIEDSPKTGETPA
jgi:hypothetical protein